MIALSESVSALAVQAATNSRSSSIELLRPHVNRLSAKWKPGATLGITSSMALATASLSDVPQKIGKNTFFNTFKSGLLNRGSFILVIAPPSTKAQIILLRQAAPRRPRTRRTAQILALLACLRTGCHFSPGCARARGD